jgi:hypothetical protein
MKNKIKLTKNEKEHMFKDWDRINSPSGRATNIIIEDILKYNKILCIRCKKKVLIDDDCADRAIKGFGSNLSIHSNMPFSLLSGSYIDSPYYVLCHNCDKFIKRSIGFIPEKWDSKWFPQISTPWLDKKTAPSKSRWFISYKDKHDIPHTKALVSKMLTEAIKKYKKAFPECPHSETKLKRLLNGYLSYDRDYPEF